jgi:hypothetical protein
MAGSPRCATAPRNRATKATQDSEPWGPLASRARFPVYRVGMKIAVIAESANVVFSDPVPPE